MSKEVVQGDGDPRIKFKNKEYTVSDLPSQLPAPGEYDIAKHLDGPLREGKSYEEAYSDVARAELAGRAHLFHAEMQQKYCGKLSGNIVLPKIMYQREKDVGRRCLPPRTYQVVIGDPEDAARIARLHVRKQPNFTTAFKSSVISTTDNEKWAEMREHLVTAFLPKLSLSRIFPISLERAKVATQRFEELSGGCTKPIDLNDFLLNETQAQLQLAMFGEDNEFQERTNERYRRAMEGSENPAYVPKFLAELGERFKRDTNSCPVFFEGSRPPQDVQCPFKGPLANRIATVPNNDAPTAEGNALIFAFAGHDTTANTMTWLLYELCRHPHFMAQVQAEVDKFYQDLNGRDPEYDDLKRLPFMTRCIMETLRKWPAVANGTFREIQFDDSVKGPKGENVRLPKGTFVQIGNWSRHRNPELWGSTADEFDPNREFRDSEMWHGQALAAYTPATPRFSPFTFPPRSCIGKDFANLETRLILAALLHKYDLQLVPEYMALDKESEKSIGINYGTLAPRNLKAPPSQKYAEGGYMISNRVPTGLFFTAQRRQPLGVPTSHL